MDLEPTLRIGLKDLEPYLDDLIIAGGWVPYLYAAHEQPSQEAVALKTRDLDLAVPREVRERAKTIDQVDHDLHSETPLHASLPQGCTVHGGITAIELLNQ